ncbi:fluoride efflux transporter FluC, partial [Arthrobacter sp. HMWF013]|uniref:fluoride efflux transporter FluC n=1 Tax=Arthrobacter sp. HMWF013 TaxID=2056849 RepID=UPI000D4D7769
MKNAGMPDWRAWLAVAAGGLIGTELRYALGLVFPESAGQVPWTTLGINVAGSFVLAVLTTLW